MLSLGCAAQADQLELEFADHVLQPEWRIEEAGICEVSIAIPCVGNYQEYVRRMRRFMPGSTQQQPKTEMF